MFRNKAGSFCASIGLVALALTLLTACTDASLRETPPPPPKKADNLLRVKGNYCTEPSQDVKFPVKVLFVVDQSTSLQCTDSKKLRFDALQSAVNTLQRQPNAEFAVIGFSNNIKSSTTDKKTFTRDTSDIQQFLKEGKLGPGTDYQGALATALRTIESDMRDTTTAELARTRYVINFVSDGVPVPRCKQGCEDGVDVCMDGEDNDGDGKVDGADSDCNDINNNSKHPDNLYIQCNADVDLDEPEFKNQYVDWNDTCAAYNMPRQIQKRVQDILELEESFNVGGVTLNTILLFSPQSVVNGVCPMAAQNFAIDRKKAAPLLRKMADAGNGTFRDINLAQSDDSFLEFEVSSLKAEQTLTAMYARNDHAVATPNGPVPDSDTDGLSDEYESEKGLEEHRVDSDGDLYSDLFEKVLAEEGFDPADKSIPAMPCQSKRDGDGDGLRDCEEDAIGTKTNNPDTDADGLSDWAELIAGTEPLEEDAYSDVDFDGIKNLDEIRGGSDPLSADESSYRSSRITYGVEDQGLEKFGNDERHCYDFDIRGIRLVTTPVPRNRGLNRILIRASERPAQIAGVSGEIRTACVEAFYNEGGIKKPADGLINLTQESLDETRQSLSEKFDELAECSMVNGKSRGNVENMVKKCMNSKIEVDQRLYPQEDLFQMLRRHVKGNLEPRLPKRPFQFFRPLANFNPQRDCFRPWEINRVKSFLTKATEKCLECAGDQSSGNSQP